MSEPRSAPTVLQMVLGRRLQDLRVAANLTAQEAGKRIRQASTTVTRMERAEVTLKWATVKALLETYGVGEAEAKEFLDLTEQANAPGWWQSYRDALPSWFAVYVSLETSATQIRLYEPQVIPGLLQTEDYARDVLRVGFPRVSSDELERRVALRMERRALLTRPDAPQLWVVMDETVLRRRASDADVMQAQIDHLLEASQLPNVTLQVARFSDGLHPGAFGPFTHFRFQVSEFPDVVCNDSVSSATYIEDRVEVALYREVLDRMSAQAISKRRTVEFLGDVRKELLNESRP
ncbi:helix-turn-helix domain-containing protein [Streptomyces prunicolor]|uniref:helix-turn-helix domain-containing protein n=1 Tax=Streptomyces prunicolor TaxID=67348 RepID=UPI000366C361|nr:helix-turn-helix transcriptional regulator [Streptomyces prunicolor]